MAEQLVLAQGDDAVDDVEARVSCREVGLEAQDVADGVQAGLKNEVVRPREGGAIAGFGQLDEGVTDFGRSAGGTLAQRVTETGQPPRGGRSRSGTAGGRVG